MRTTYDIYVVDADGYVDLVVTKLEGDGAFILDRAEKELFLAVSKADRGNHKALPVRVNVIMVEDDGMKRPKETLKAKIYA